MTSQRVETGPGSARAVTGGSGANGLMISFTLILVHYLAIGTVWFTCTVKTCN